jgi:nucleotide-binding universal stress UspA family protein
MPDKAPLVERTIPVHPLLPPMSLVRACLERPLLTASAARDLPEDHRFAGSSSPHLRMQAPAVLAEHILVTTDGSESANLAIPFALAAIRACDSRRVTLLRVLTPKLAPPVNALDWAMQRAHAEASLEQFIGRFDDGTGLRGRINPVVVEGLAAEQILHFAEANDVDLIVIASHGSDDAWPMGSTTHKVVASGVASVLVVPTDDIRTIRSVLVPLDCSTRAECVLPLASKLGEVHRAELAFVHVVPCPEAPHHLPVGQRERELIDDLTRCNRERAEAYLADVSTRFASRGISVRSEVLVDTNPARVIEQLAKCSSHDLVLLCAHGAGCQPGERYGTIPRRLVDSLVKPLWLIQDLPREIASSHQIHDGRTDRA